MARALRRPSVAASASLAALVAVSTLVHWLTGRRVAGLWIMPDEAIYGVRALGLWQHGSLPLFGSSGAGYSALYPVFAGGPLSIGSQATGYAILKVVQALVMSLAAWPVYAYTRRLVPEGYALLAAALTLACPLVLFSGFVMTEVLYYPLAAAALLASARAIATARLRDQAIALVLIAAAVATRVQGIVLLAVLVVALLVDALLARRRPDVRRFWPVWSLTAAGALVAAILPGAFGAYETAVNGSYRAGPAARLTYDHFAFLILTVGVVPAGALVLCLVEAARSRTVDAGMRGLVAITASAVVLVTLQVGTFSSRFSPHLLGRDLAALPPVVFAVFAVWLGRGGARPRLVTSLTAVGLLAVLTTVPWNDLVVPDALPDSLGIAILLDDPLGWRPATVVAILGAILLLLFVLAPRLDLLAVVVVLLLGWGTVAGSARVDTATDGAQVALVGTPRDWIDGYATSDVAYLYNGDLAAWTVVWEQRFWNPRIDRVVSILPHFVPGPISQRVIALPRDGRLPIDERYAVANDQVQFEGTPVAHQDRGPDQYGLTLWQLQRPARLSYLIQGTIPNGDIDGHAVVNAFNCAGGTLQLTLLPKATNRLEIDLDGRVATVEHIAGRSVWHGEIRVPASHGPAPCTFSILPDGLLGSTVIRFVRAA
ncbi:MAG TPA: glycosyltransferase family 39 protein [Gaiellaceae bacterium]|nr:glycosyltransferase family 39 protein [Gaiellaceae bacterium]